MIQKQKNSGQVLILGIVMLLILLFAVFFFFDIHNVIRGKIKLETAEQAAALAAARWQAESLNLVGELNLLIAAETVLQDENIAVPEHLINTENPDFYAQGHARVLALNEMQSRVSFIGPLIALTAAQQTAKNNGINPVNPTGNIVDPQNVADDFDEYQRRLESNSSIYVENNTINGYAWKEPYKKLLREIQSNGIAVRPSAMVVGIEGIQPSYLADETLYAAIIACSKGYPAWCHWRLRQLIKMDDSYFEGSEWYSPDFSWIRFSQQSEIYPIEVTMNNGVSSLYEDFKQQSPAFGHEAMSMEKAMLYRSNFYHYNHRWMPDSVTYSGPDISEFSPWRRGIYLRRDIAEYALYGGAAAYAECVGHIPSVITFKSNYNEIQANTAASGKAALNSNKPLIKKNNSSRVQVGGNYSNDMQNSGCVAKPVGMLKSGASPVTIPIVLPVFEQVNLIPSSLQLIRIFSFKWPPVEQFVVALKGYLENEEKEKKRSIYDEDFTVPAGTEYMLEALRLLGTKEFRRKGYNPDFKGINYTKETLENLFSEENKLYDPIKNPNGPGWLQQPAIHYGRKYKIPEEAKKSRLYYYTAEIANNLNRPIIEKNKTAKIKEALYVIPPESETWIFFDGRYIRAKGNDFFESMEEDPYNGCGTVRTGRPGGITPGTNSGPPRL